MSKKTDSNFYTAKEKLGLLSFGDPGAGDKVQVTDTYLVALARKLDNKIKDRPGLKKHLVKVRHIARKAKSKASGLKKVAHRSASTATTAEPVSKQRVENIRFQPVAKPIVSIIIPAFNKAEMTVSCLESLARNEDPRVPAQIIVVDNASADETTLLENVSGLTYVRNDENLGFVGGCNSGVPAAKGEYLVFLNNDTEVTPDWLYELFATISNDSAVGLVGSKIVYPNGLLQEAGGVIFQDGTGLNYGKFDQADSYQYNYVREVDYCSGASIIIRKKLFEDFGGFDKLYQPAYYEDTDLSFKVRKAGLRVLYQPKSVLYHIEGGTAGTNLNIGFKKYQEINREKFLKRWDKELKGDHVSPGDYYLGRDRSGDKLALIIEEALPTPDKDSGSVRMVAMIRGLQSLGYKVTFWPNNLKKIEPYASNLQQMGVEVVYGSVDFIQFAKHYAHFYDAVIMSRPEICAKYINVCKSLFTNAKLIYDTVDLHFLRLARQAEIETSNAEALLEQSKWFRVLELGLMERTDATLVVSTLEVEKLQEEAIDANIYIVSNIHELRPEAYKKGFNDRHDILFVGNYAHLPNRDSIKWFVKDIFPVVLKELPDVKLHVVGANMPDSLQKDLQGKNIIVDGYLSDEELASLLMKSRVFVAPLRYGAGVKGKVGQAIEYGLPSVTSSIAAEGMHIQDGVSGLLADDAKTFATQVVKLYKDPLLWQTIQTNAKTVLEKHFSLDEATAMLKKILG
ncbi:MAG TPA: glycosyltransferase [Candidatus Saccharimonadales bacterium]|nr:glycosyltransferase [Candidatus Saccharimonadales bacterium]